MPAKDSSTKLTSKQIMARLDTYLPALNTGLMDVRVQDAIIKHPLVRSLMVPECDLEARRRCIRLVSKTLDSVGPVLPLILQYQSVNQLQKCGTQCEKAHPEMKAAIEGLVVPPMSQALQTKLLKSLSERSEKDPIMKFWLEHHKESLQQSTDPAKRFVKVGTGSLHLPRISKPTNDSSQSTASPTAATTPTGRKRNSSVIKQHQQATNTPEIELNPTVALYLKVKIAKDILTDLGDRVQGAVCQVFWECWDESFMMLADIVGIEALCEADAGRLFRPQGDAALYISNYRVTKKRKVEEGRRISAFSALSDVPAYGIGDNESFNKNNNNIDHDNGSEFYQNGVDMSVTSISISNPNTAAFTNMTLATSVPSLSITSGSSDASSPLSPQNNKQGAGSPSIDGTINSENSGMNPVGYMNSDSSLPLIDSTDLNYILSGAYNNQKQIQDQNKNQNQAGNVNNYAKFQDEFKRANLRERIIMMEQGSLLNDKVDSKSIVW